MSPIETNLSILYSILLLTGRWAMSPIETLFWGNLSTQMVDREVGNVAH